MKSVGHFTGKMHFTPAKRRASGRIEARAAGLIPGGLFVFLAGAVEEDTRTHACLPLNI